jgi:glutathione S-transferase
VTLADILLIPMVEYVKAMPEGKELMSAFPNLRRATDKLAQRPSYVAATQPPVA